MKAVGASLVRAGMLKLLNTPSRLDSDVASSPVLPFARTHTHTEMNTGMERNFKHLSCAFSAMNNALIEIG